MIVRFDLSRDIIPKTLIKTFHETKRVNKNDHKYIINFDNADIKQKRFILSTYLGDKVIGNKTDIDIERLFKMRIRKIIEELEVDLQEFS